MMKRLKATMLAAALSMLPAAASALVIHDEAIDGDLALPPGTDVGTLSLGTNSILGSSAVYARPGVFDGDDIRFTVAAGQVLTNVTFSFFDVVYSGTAHDAVTIYYLADVISVESLGVKNFDVDLSPQVMFSGTSGASDYLLRNFGFGIQRDLSQTLDTASWNYRIDLTTELAPVPLPAALPLLAAGLGAMGLLRRRRRSRAT